MEDIAKTTKSTSNKNKKNTKWILFIIAAFFVGGVLGYFVGGNVKETQIREQYDQEVSKIQAEAANAKDDVSSGLKEGQATVSEGQQTIESLQAENATLRSTIETQNAKIADLEKQLEEAQNSEDSSDQVPNN